MYPGFQPPNAQCVPQKKLSGTLRGSGEPTGFTKDGEPVPLSKNGPSLLHLTGADDHTCSRCQVGEVHIDVGICQPPECLCGGSGVILKIDNGDRPLLVHPQPNVLRLSPRRCHVL